MPTGGMADDIPPLSILDGAALFLDFDGTLVELADAPDAISVAPDVPPLLARLDRRLEGRLALVSGRSIGDLERHLDCSGIGVSGSHGLELRLRDGGHLTLGGRHDLSAARQEVHRLASAAPGLIVEDKPFSIALHYRQAPAEEARVAKAMSELAGRTGLALQEGKMVVELRPAGADKGDAVRAFMAEPGFAGARPLFVGDDLTDEDAFAAAASMGGGGILVGPRRATAAHWRLPDVRAVIAWLDEASR
jgi:trehalose 6-phosphate phosphatase